MSLVVISHILLMSLGFLGGATDKRNCLPMQENQEMQFPSLGWEDPLEEGMATQSSILAWKIPWTEEPGRLLSIVWVAKSQIRLK